MSSAAMEIRVDEYGHGGKADFFSAVRLG